MTQTSLRIPKLFIALFFISAFTLLFVSGCKKDEDDPKSNANVDFVKWKINGVDYNARIVDSDTETVDSKLVRRIFGGAVDGKTSDIVMLNFENSLPTGNYQVSFDAGGFGGIYSRNDTSAYLITRGALVLTNVTNRLEGTFNFTCQASAIDSLIVSEGSFSIKK